jgi:hypothetical protein
MANIGIINLNGGLFTPLIDVRSDIDKHKSGCRVLDNFFPRIYGVVERRPGTRFVKLAKET